MTIHGGVRVKPSHEVLAILNGKASPRQSVGAFAAQWPSTAFGELLGELAWKNESGRGLRVLQRVSSYGSNVGGFGARWPSTALFAA